MDRSPTDQSPRAPVRQKLKAPRRISAILAKLLLRNRTQIAVAYWRVHAGDWQAFFENCA